MSSSTPNELRHTPHPLASPDSDNPFKHDALGRKPLSEKLTKLVRSFAGQPFVLAINGVWGAGKSVFLDMWGASLKQQGFQTLRFNAWECDHSDDPFASVFSEFRKLTKTTAAEEDSALLSFYNNAKEKAVPILSKAGAAIIKHATLGVLDWKSSDTEAIFGELAEASAKQLLDKAEKEKQSISAFREELTTFVAKVGTPDTPVVYFIDELDRCRPTYAIAVLERVKHLLNVPGVVFVFAWDRNQLNETVKSIYGKQADPSGYLFRFIDLEFNLPMVNHRFYCHNLLKRFGIFQYLEKTAPTLHVKFFVEVFSRLAKQLSFSIRDQEKAFTSFTVILRVTPLSEWRFIEPLLILIMLRVKRPDLYQDICALTAKPLDAADRLSQLVEKLPHALGKGYWGSADGKSFEGYLLGMLPEDVRNSIGKYVLVASRQNQGRAAEADNPINRAIAVSDGFESAGGLLVYLISKMEFSENFA